VLGIVLAPFALAGAIVHAPLVVLIQLLRRLRLSAPTKATVLPAAALLGALATWLLWAVLLSAGERGLARMAAALTLVLVFPLWGAAALLLTERISLAVRVLRSWPRGRRQRRDTVAELLAEHDRVVALVGESATSRG
jgi:hypothetical protein